MNAHSTPADLVSAAAARASHSIFQAETPIVNARALVFAIEAIANHGIEKEAGEALGVVAQQMAALLDQAEELRREALGALHPIVHPA